jgi:hypothetical protein
LASAAEASCHCKLDTVTLTAKKPEVKKPEPEAKK